jgi:hypothetical protein
MEKPRRPMSLSAFVRSGGIASLLAGPFLVLGHVLNLFATGMT